MTKHVELNNSLEKYIIDHSNELDPVLREIIDYNTTLGTTDSYIVSYGNVETVAGLGTFGAQLKDVGGNMWTQLMFTPNADITTQVKIFMNAFQIEDDEKSIIEFDNGSIETLYNLYEGTERSIKRAFNLTHKNNEIFNK